MTENLSLIRAQQTTPAILQLSLRFYVSPRKIKNAFAGIYHERQQQELSGANEDSEKTQELALKCTWHFPVGCNKKRVIEKRSHTQHNQFPEIKSRT
jgi:hypothetical protein